MNKYLDYDENRQPDLVIEDTNTPDVKITYMCWHYPSGVATFEDSKWKICRIREREAIGESFNDGRDDDVMITEFMWPDGSKAYNFNIRAIDRLNFTYAL